MSEEQATNSQAEETGQVQETTESEEQTPQAKTVDDLPEWAKKEIKDLRKESAGNRKKLKDIEDKDKSEQQKLLEERDTLLQEKADWQRERTHSRFKEQINLTNPRLALGAALEAGYELDLDSEGRIANIDNIRRTLKKDNPREFGDGSANGGNTGPAKQPESKADWVSGLLGVSDK